MSTQCHSNVSITDKWNDWSFKNALLKKQNSKSNEKQNRITKAILTKTHENKSHYSWKSSEREEYKTKDATMENHENERNAKK